MRKSPWPAPHDPEHLFTKALLAHGPLPPNGWRVTRAAGGKAIYVVAGSKESGVFVRDVVRLFTEEVAMRYAIKKWSLTHCHRVGQMWKNLFMLWVWEQIDENNST